MDTLTPQQRSERMSRVRSRDTQPELRLRKLVWGLGYRYRTHRRDVPGKPDIVFAGQKRAIFLHGCFWHRHDCRSGQRSPKTRLAFWREKFQKNVARDAAVRSQLRAIGWRALIVWECQLTNEAVIARRVRRFLDA
jgi:DNA mismatch endonuclease (patch repair protein)